MNISTGQDLQIFYTGDTGNNSPSFGGYQEIANIAEFPTIIQSSSVENIETYDSDYSSVLTGDKAIDAFPITVNYVIDEPSHKFLEQAAEQQTPIQVKVKYTTDEEANAESYIVLNGYVSSNNLTGDKDAVVQRSYLFTPETVVTQGFAPIQPLLRRSDYGLGSDGIDAPQYTPATGQIAGNGFIQIPAAATGNPASTNLIGVGLTNNKNEASIVMSETGDLKLYARNQNTAWTRIYTSTEQDTRYARLGQPANFGNLTITGTISSTGKMIAPASNGFQTASAGDYWSSLSAEAGYGMIWRYNSSSTKANEFLGIDQNSKLVFRQAIDNANNYKNWNVYHEGFKPSKSDVGLSNVTNDAQLKIASNLNDLNNKATARTNLDVYSRTETINVAARYTLPVHNTGSRGFLPIAQIKNSGNGAGYMNFTIYGANNYGYSASNVDQVAISCRNISSMTAETITQIVKHVTVLQSSVSRLQIGLSPVDIAAGIWNVYLIATNGFYSGVGMEIGNVVGGGSFITGFMNDRIMPAWTTTVPDNLVTVAPENTITSTSVIPVTNGGTGATTKEVAASNLGLGATDTVTFKNIILTNTQDPTINLQTSIIRSNSANQMVLSAPAGIFIRPNGDADSTKQMRYNNDGTLVFSGTAITLNGSLAMNGGITSNNSITLTNASTDTAFTTNGAKFRATPSGVAVISTTSSIFLRPKGDTDSTVQIQYKSDGSITCEGSSLSVSGVLNANSLNLTNALAVNQGGTGATTAAAARTNLGLAYGNTAGTVAQGDDWRLNSISQKTGGMMNGALGVSNGSTGITLATQGTWLLWNEESGKGSGSLVVNGGGGTEGIFRVRLVNAANTVEYSRFEFRRDSTLFASEGLRCVAGRVRAFASVAPTYVTIDVDGLNKGINFFDSDQRLKENILPVQEGKALSQLKLINPVSYKFKDTHWTDMNDVQHTMMGKSYSYGVIAQEIIDVIPDAVNVMEDERGSMSLDPLAMIGFLLSVTKDLSAQIDAMKTSIEELMNK
ncbi:MULTISPECIES: tail fiber domain-containing protein [Serratia]|nr:MULTISPECIES: tail fiber domain-containing protein [Serratia]EHT9936644.1 tail fiber domain-containing protein [Serratia marcescens]EIJ6676438.1 tail fiber domain-containing protein [Serratia marcescens]MDP8601210.1 tail fiber domain-containing protein [Serratia marcescens]MDP8685910.1 tail fiber domain-containing protein [Serratia marcescens]MDP8794808.1 tail fiber domain-containing protein [Serratia marcescens]